MYKLYQQSKPEIIFSRYLHLHYQVRTHALYTCCNFYVCKIENAGKLIWNYSVKRHNDKLWPNHGKTPRIGQIQWFCQMLGVLHFQPWRTVYINYRYCKQKMRQWKGGGLEGHSDLCSCTWRVWTNDFDAQMSGIKFWNPGKSKTCLKTLFYEILSGCLHFGLFS
jgi:hypothetical protein